MPARRPPFDGAFWLLAVLGGTWIGVLSRWLVYPDLNLDYPFPGGDGYDWLANGLALAGEPVRYSGRAPLLPLLVAALDRMGGLSWLPVASQGLVVVLALSLYVAARARFQPAVGLALGVTALGSAWVQANALVIGADLLAVTLLAAALAAWIWAGSGDAPVAALRLTAGILAGLSAVAQPGIALALFPAAAVALIGRPGREWGSRGVWAMTLLLGLLPVAAWEVLGPPGSGGEGLVGVSHATLFAASLGGVGFYARAAAEHAGWPALLLAGAGGLMAAKRWVRDPAGRLALALTLVIAVFFAVLYRWRDARFMLHAVPSAALLAGGALAWVVERSRVVFVIAGVMLVAGGVLPQAGDRREHPAARARAAWTAFQPRPDSETTAAAAVDRSAVLLLQAGSGVEERYRDQTRLGNALRRRVKPAPAALYPPNWWGWRRLEPLQPVGGHVLARWRWNGESWLVAGPRGGGGMAASALAADPPPDVAAQWSLAVAVGAGAERPDGLLAVFADPERDGEWLRLLPFAAETSSLFVLTDPAEQRALLPQLPAEGARRRLGGLEIWRSRFKGWPVEVVRSDAARERLEALR